MAHAALPPPAALFLSLDGVTIGPRGNATIRKSPINAHHMVGSNGKLAVEGSGHLAKIRPPPPSLEP
jgi:hypothetical protein